jgi:tRNA G46 methylase TrmB
VIGRARQTLARNERADALRDQEAPLYDRAAARFLRRREAGRQKDTDEKLALLLGHVGRCRRLVDVGCGWGQFLAEAAGRADEFWGVDESPDRAADAARTCPAARLVICRTDRLGEFERKLAFRRASHEAAPDGNVRISRRSLREFLTKHWALRSPMAAMEMRETHNVFRRGETVLRL